ncbi:MAG: hypothetical protein ACFFC7_15955 [Candidatus Hermodarchaeota archaeon]
MHSLSSSKGKILRVITFLVIILFACSLLSTPTFEILASEGKKQITFPVNDTFDLENEAGALKYQFVFEMHDYGYFARVRIHGGILVGSTPQSLEISVYLDGNKTNALFMRSQNHRLAYSFHSESEYVVLLNYPPTHPELPGLKTLHNLTVTLSFSFTSSSKGTGIVHDIIFEVFTPLLLQNDEWREITLLQEKNSWKIIPYSLGFYEFETMLILPKLSNNQILISLDIILKIAGLSLDSWNLAISNGTTQNTARNLLHVSFDSVQLTNNNLILEFIFDPPQVSSDEILYLEIEIKGLITAKLEGNDSNNDIEAPVMKSLTEILLALQGLMLILPLLIYYRNRRLKKS